LGSAKPSSLAKTIELAFPVSIVTYSLAAVGSIAQSMTRR